MPETRTDLVDGFIYMQCKRILRKFQLGLKWPNNNGQNITISKKYLEP